TRSTARGSIWRAPDDSLQGTAWALSQWRLRHAFSRSPDSAMEPRDPPRLGGALGPACGDGRGVSVSRPCEREVRAVTVGEEEGEAEQDDDDDDRLYSDEWYRRSQRAPGRRAHGSTAARRSDEDAATLVPSR